VYSTYLGGSGGSLGFGITVDAGGNAYVTGSTGPGFPTTPGAFQTAFRGSTDDAFVSKLNAAGSALLYSTYLGGSTLGDSGAAIAVDGAGNAYVTGGTNSSHFPTTPGAFQTTPGGRGDAFISKFNLGVTLTPASLTFAAQPVGTFSVPQQATLLNATGAPLKISTFGSTGDFALDFKCPCTLAAGASRTLTVTFTPTSVGTRLGTVTISDNAPGSPHKVRLRGTGSGAGSIILALAPASLTFGSIVVGDTSAPQTVTVTNNGTVAASLLTPFGLFIRGTNAPDFHLDSHCGTSLAPHASCTAAVTFKPTTTGGRTGLFAVRQGAATVRIPLSGTGTP